MKKLLNKKSGFTLIELMIVVAILGILAAVAIPAFATYLRRSKTAEAYENIEAMFKSISAYYNKEFVSSASINATTAAHCGVAATSTFATGSIGDVKVAMDATATGPFEENTGIGFEVGPSYYQYTNVGGNAGCDGSAGTTREVITALGDLDKDTSLATFSLATATNGSNEIYKAGQVYVNQELE